MKLSRNRLHEIIFEADTKAGKIFDIILIISITASVLVVMADSVASLNSSFGNYFYAAE
jgi:voltage-gated potassium channel